MRPRFLLIAALALVSSCAESGVAPAGQCAGSECATASAVLGYLDRALDVMQANSLYTRSVDWPALRTDAHRQTSSASTFAEARAGIAYALNKLGDTRAYLAAPGLAVAAGGALASASRTPQAVGSIVGGRIAWISVPGQFSGGDTAAAFTNQVRDVVADLDRANPCGWMVDLRSVLGGAIWPALAGLAPVLGDGTVGAFVDASGIRTTWFVSRGTAGTLIPGGVANVGAAVTQAYTLTRPMPPVAVLLGTSTNGAGEAIATAFSGRPLTRSFGQHTSGLPTIDQGFVLSDGWTLVLTVAADQDRTGKVFWPRAIVPDETQPMALTYPLADDDAGVAARTWLMTTSACK